MTDEKQTLTAYTYMAETPCVKVIRNTIRLPQIDKNGNVLQWTTYPAIKLNFDNRLCRVDENFARQYRNVDGERLTLDGLVKLIESNDDYYDGEHGSGAGKFRLVLGPGVTPSAEVEKALVDAAKPKGPTYTSGVKAKR